MGSGHTIVVTGKHRRDGNKGIMVAWVMDNCLMVEVDMVESMAKDGQLQVDDNMLLLLLVLTHDGVSLGIYVLLVR